MSEASAFHYDPIVVSSENTVVSEYVPEKKAATGYQSEAQLETEFIRLLENQAYEYLPITSEEKLVANVRQQLELLMASPSRILSGIASSPVRLLERTRESLRKRSGFKKTTFNC